MGPIKANHNHNNFTRVTTGNFTVTNESAVLVDKTIGAATTVTIPAAVATGSRRALFVIDAKGDAATNNITITPASGNINGTTSYVLSENYGAVMLIDDTGEWIAMRFAPAALSAGELAFLDGVTAGVAAANKALVLGASLNLGAGGSTIAITDRMTSTDGVASGTAKVFGGLAYSNTAASSAVASTSAETLFDTSYAMPANTLKAGTMVKIRYQGIATTTVANDTLLIKLVIGGVGGTALITAAAVDVANSDTFSGEFVLQCRTAGTTGTVVGTGVYKTTAAEGTMTAKDDILPSTTLNTTTQQVIGVTATWNTTNANSARLDVMTVEIY